MNRRPAASGRAGRAPHAGGKHKKINSFFFLNKVNNLKENYRISSFKRCNIISANLYNKYYLNNKKSK